MCREVRLPHRKVQLRYELNKIKNSFFSGVEREKFLCAAAANDAGDTFTSPVLAAAAAMSIYTHTHTPQLKSHTFFQGGEIA